ncbi:amidohydrolase family protein [Pseudorhodoplanes sinuspersici]|uniref:2-pyrone-4,6-dicarboxylate hydrolase n=1 Tax=Pseudorhodoplanes sinuspersici TaxID=1235591 RepID=A0A1W6ZW37_9HYPH|nr:amidohydrolase family protein [Pseudorhodoplanes sinuspersici]ARQ01526.1 2-pyrone-4,6-dicarboxylate hydrolase [Pseudorhodoplanes sinuspersici]RKE73229.1 putative TIM-barrel fold metal-dependent hydrolase [Pseudorhodoplanes sinuspersici]
MSAVFDLSTRRKPAFKLPAGSTDAHCHVFGPGDVFPYASNRRYTPDDAPKEMLKSLHDFLGIDRAVIVQASCHGNDNRAMLDALAWRPDHYRGVAILDENSSGNDIAAMARAGVRGARFNFVKHLGGSPDMDVFNNILRRIKPLGWHVVLHVDAPDIIPLSDMIRNLPLPFIIDHMGRVPAKDGLDQKPLLALLDLAKLDRCWIKVCGAERIDFPPYDKAVPIARKIVDTIPDRVLWGTDFPHPNSTHEADEADLVDLIPKIAPDPMVQKKLLVDNPAKLYGF